MSSWVINENWFSKLKLQFWQGYLLMPSWTDNWCFFQFCAFVKDLGHLSQNSLTFSWKLRTCRCKQALTSKLATHCSHWNLRTTEYFLLYLISHLLMWISDCLADTGLPQNLQGNNFAAIKIINFSRKKNRQNEADPSYLTVANFDFTRKINNFLPIVFLPGFSSMSMSKCGSSPWSSVESSGSVVFTSKAS